MAGIAQLFKMGPKCDVVPVLASLGGKGFIVERIKARHSATFLFGAQARAGVWPVGCQQEENMFGWAILELYRDMIFLLVAYLLHLQP